jgi:hypothetical protein
MTGKLPAEPSSVDIVVSICSSLEFPGDLLVKEIFRSAEAWWNYSDLQFSAICYRRN